MIQSLSKGSIMKSQKEISFDVISSLRGQGKSDSEILLVGPMILLESFRKGEWSKTKGSTDDNEILRYGKDLLKNWMKRDPRLNGGEKYTPKNPRGPREKTETTPNLRLILDQVKKSDPNNTQLIQELEERIMWEEIKKVG